MKIQCPNCGQSVVVNGLGRKPLNIPLKNVCEALELHCDVGQAAKELGCSVGYIYNACKEHGTAPRDVMKAKAGEQ